MLLLLLVALWLRLRACTVHTDCCMLVSDHARYVLIDTHARSQVIVVDGGSALQELKVEMKPKL
jgi:hypothetical protein